MTEKHLGKIMSVKFGYKNSMFGLHLELGSGENSGWRVITSISYNPKLNNQAETNQRALEMLIEIKKLLEEARVSTIDELKDIPIEAEFNGNVLEKYRILNEVL